MTSNKQIVENEAFKMGFTLLKIKPIEKFKPEIKLTHKKINKQFYTRSTASFQLLNAV